MASQSASDLCSVDYLIVSISLRMERFSVMLLWYIKNEVKINLKLLKPLS